MKLIKTISQTPRTRWNLIQDNDGDFFIRVEGEFCNPTPSENFAEILAFERRFERRGHRIYENPLWSNPSIEKGI